MPKNNKQECTEKIHKLVPEILELNWGCEVIVNLGYTKERAVITRCLDTSGDMFQYYTLPLSRGGQEFCVSKSKMQSIGRPIQLSDVLRAITPKDDLNPYGGLPPSYQNKIEYTIQQLLMFYNLSLPFEQQSEGLYKFINNIL